jgi:peptidoglycan/xylan/chitin deacetylase (PgdA/CDA1 family)
MPDRSPLFRTAFCAVYKYSGAMALHEAVARLCGQRFATILLFHRVTDVIPEDGLTVHPERFRQIANLLQRRFHVVPLGEVFQMAKGLKELPGRSVAITFDDCYADNLQAARLLAQLGLPATFFIPTGYIGSARRFAWDEHLPPMPNLTWEQVREIAALGHDLGSHTVNHVNMGEVGPETALYELSRSREVLEERTGRPVRLFAYPFGGPNNLRPEYVPLITECGYEGGVSAYGGFVRPGGDFRVLPREAVPYFKNMDYLEMHLSGCLHWLYWLRGRDRALKLAPSPYTGLTMAPQRPASGTHHG